MANQLTIFLLGLSILANVGLLIDNWRASIVVSVPDGDSLQLLDGRRVRLVGIDAPERGQCLGEEARAALSAAVLGRHVRLKEVVTDSYGRQLAIVIISDFPFVSSVSYDRLINSMLLSQGLARSTGSSTLYGKVLKDAEQVAKTEKLGIWSENCRTDQPKGDYTIKGNRRAGKKTYFLPDCPNYPDVLIDEAFGDSWFCSEKEAKGAGFTKSPTCR